MDDEKKARFQADTGYITKHFVADAARLFRGEHLPLQGPAQHFGDDAGNRSAPGDEGNDIARFSTDPANAACEKGFLHSVVKSNVKGRKSMVSQQGKVAEGLVEASAQGGNDDNFAEVPPKGIIQGQFEVSLVFVTRMFNHADSSPFHRTSNVGGQRVKVADDDGRDPSESQEVTGSAVGSEENVFRAN